MSCRRQHVSRWRPSVLLCFSCAGFIASLLSMQSRYSHPMPAFVSLGGNRISVPHARHAAVQTRGQIMWQARSSVGVRSRTGGQFEARLAASSTSRFLLPASPQRSSEWWLYFFTALCAIVCLWTALDCLLDPNIEYPWGLLRIAIPTALLVAPGAAVQACTWMSKLPCGLEDVEGKPLSKVSTVFLGDSLTQGSLSANFLQVLEQRHPAKGSFVNCGMNMRPAPDLLQGTLLEDVAALKPTHGAIILIGTNDLIRYTLLPAMLRQPVADWLKSYARNLKDVLGRLECGGIKVTLASAPILGEDPTSEEGSLGSKMAETVRQVAKIHSCGYAPLYEETVAHIQAASANCSLAPRSRPYNAPESLALLCALPWRMYAARQSLEMLQAEQGLELTVDLVHFGPLFADLAADVFEEALEFKRT